MSESEDGKESALGAWRTIAIVAFELLLLALVYGYAAHRGFTAESAMAFGSLCTAATASVGAVALKALGEHLGNGSGLKGALSALMSDTKPGDPAPVKPQ